MGRVSRFFLGSDFHPAGEAVDPSPVEVALAELAADRATPRVTTREAAMSLTVVNRARDLLCGVLAGLPLTRVRTRAPDGADGVDLGPGWLAAPDPLFTRGAFVSHVTDDLFFHGHAYCRVTAQDVDRRPVALQWMPFTQCHQDDATRPVQVTGIVWQTPWGDTYDVTPGELVAFDSPVTGVLAVGSTALDIAARLDRAALRFAGADLAMGYLHQVAGEPLTRDQAVELVTAWSESRSANTTAYLSQDLAYQESTMDPAKLQLVEARAYQDASLARLVNMPSYVLGVAVPHDSMTYKTSALARFDLIDFGIAPYLACWEQTLSSDQVMPHGTAVRFELDAFLRTAEIEAASARGAGALPQEATAP